MTNVRFDRARMGNIRGWGGPLTPSWHKMTLRLQHRILERMREFGIIAVLPAFAGHVPRALTRIYPNANVTKIDKWNKFSDEYCWSVNFFFFRIQIPEEKRKLT